MKLTKETPLEEKFVERCKRIKHRYIYINIASGLCFLFVPFWAFVRLFYCWEDSCTGLICWVCEFHWVISALLLAFMFGFILMSRELYKVSQDISVERLPTKIENHWIPGTKTFLNTISVLSHAVNKITGRHIPVSTAIDTDLVTKGSSEGGIMRGVSQCVDATSNIIRHMERGRAELEGKGPEKWTFVFTVLAFLGALFLMIGPFNNVFWS